MSNLTIDQILAERRMEESPDIYGIEKEASSQPSPSVPFPSEEVEKMASLLSEADLQSDNVQGGDSFNERVAAALILNDHITSMLKEAEYSEDKEEKKEEKKDKKEEEEEKTASFKVASFIVKADEAGYSPEEIRSFIEKQASVKGFMTGLKNLMTGTPGKALAGTGALAGAGLAGHELGETRTEEKAKKILPKVFQMGQIHGYRAGARKGFETGAYASNQAWKRRIQQSFGKNKKQGTK